MAPPHRLTHRSPTCNVAQCNESLADDSSLSILHFVASTRSICIAYALFSHTKHHDTHPAPLEQPETVSAASSAGGGIRVRKSLDPCTLGAALRADRLIEAMASENLQRNQPNRREEEWTSGRQEMPACDDAFQTTADPPRPNAIRSRGVGKRASSTPPMPCAVSAYCYSLLPDGFIRLLRLMPHRDEHAPIQCQLFDYPLLDSGKGPHLYEALSYVWGSGEKPRRVFTDEGYLRVTNNLHAALLHLRDRSLARIIWVDAICMNQEDKGEKGEQILRMAEIYSRASRVVVWLGEAKNDSDQALEDIRLAADAEFPVDKPNKQAILTLLHRPWFERIWVREQTPNSTGICY